MILQIWTRWKNLGFLKVYPIGETIPMGISVYLYHRKDLFHWEEIAQQVRAEVNEKVLIRKYKKMMENIRLRVTEP